MNKIRQFAVVTCERAAPTCFLIIILLFFTPLPAASDVCIRAEIDRPVILPDGEVHQPGLLRLCLDRAYSPVAGLHRISIGKRTVGLYLSRDRLSEGLVDDREAVIIFRRLPDDSLVLLGYAVPLRDRTRIYWIGTTGKDSARITRKLSDRLNLTTATQGGAHNIELMNAQPM